MNFIDDAKHTIVFQQLKMIILLLYIAFVRSYNSV